jgi:hypothetical protein
MATRPSDPVDSEHNPLSKRFAGRRRTGRQVRRLEVECSRGDLRFGGRTIDASPRGMLVEILTDLRNDSGGDESALEITYRALADFAKGMVVRFTGTSVTAHARIVRISVKPDAADQVLLGCQFDPSLKRIQCNELALDWVPGDEDEGDDGDDPDPDHVV